MKRIVFNDPTGEQNENFEPEWLKDLMFNEGDEFWDIDAGDAALNYYENGTRKAYVHLKGLEQYGFMVKHKYEGKTERLFTLASGEHTGETVEAYIGGNPNRYYREYFLSKETAWEAVMYFLETGDRDPSLRWEIARTVETE